MRYPSRSLAQGTSTFSAVVQAPTGSLLISSQHSQCSCSTSTFGKESVREEPLCPHRFMEQCHPPHTACFDQAESCVHQLWHLTLPHVTFRPPPLDSSFRIIHRPSLLNSTDPSKPDSRRPCMYSFNFLHFLKPPALVHH